MSDKQHFHFEAGQTYTGIPRLRATWRRITAVERDDRGRVTHVWFITDKNPVPKKSKYRIFVGTLNRNGIFGTYGPKLKAMEAKKHKGAWAGLMQAAG